MEASLQPLENSGKDGGVANVGTRIFEMTPDPLQEGIPPSQGPALLSRGPYIAQHCYYLFPFLEIECRPNEIHFSCRIFFCRQSSLDTLDLKMSRRRLRDGRVSTKLRK